MISNLCLVPQTEESVAEEEVLSEERVPNHLARHGKTPHPTVLLGQLHEKLRPHPHHLHEKLRPPPACPTADKKGNTISDFRLFFFLPVFILKFLHEESNGQSGQSKQQRRRKRRRRSMRKRMTERRVLVGGVYLSTSLLQL